MANPNPSDDLLGELAGITADLESWVAWEGLTGAFALPRAPAGAGEALFGPPPDPRVAPPAASGPAPRPLPSTAAPRPAPAAPPPTPRPAPAPPLPPAAPRVVEPQAQLGLSAKWAAITATRDPAAELERVRAELGDCRRCKLCEKRKKLVFGVGSPTARLVVVGEAPGAREDELGEPFVGPAGEMLDRMLENVLGLTRREVYILNVVKCRPPENRDPEPVEVAACRPFLDAQIDAISPRLILAVGRIAAQTLLGTSQGISGLRGRWHQFRGRIPLMPTFHPAYLLRTPSEKRKTLEDLLLVKQKLDAPE